MEARLRRLRAAGEMLREFSEAAARMLGDSATLVLFGSRARGEAGPASDYDVAAIFAERPSGDEYWRLLSEIRSAKPAGLPLDVVLLGLEELEDPLVRRMLDGCVILHDGLRIGDKLRAIGARPASDTLI